MCNNIANTALQDAASAIPSKVLKIHYQNGWLHTIRTYEKVLSTLIAIGNNSKREMNYETEQKK